MKIAQLPMGARFRYEGESYTKTGPLFATGSAGQRLIPKYALLEPLDGPSDKGENAAVAAMSVDAVSRAFDVFYQQMQRWVPHAHHDELAQARADFLKAVR
jgi:hypothetical protein